MLSYRDFMDNAKKNIVRSRLLLLTDLYYQEIDFALKIQGYMNYSVYTKLSVVNLINSYSINLNTDSYKRRIKNVC